VGGVKTSISDTEAYRTVCREAAIDDAKLAVFKSASAYRCILEHAAPSVGSVCLDYIKKHQPELLPLFPKFQENDSIGNPQTATYEVGEFSPTTIRYVKVLAEVMGLFGSLDGFNIVEVGCGYGGQAKVIQDVFKVNYEIIDLPEVEDLTMRYAEKLGFTCGKYSGAGKRDLFISNYAFTEVSVELQNKFLNEVIPHCKRGYVTCNFLTSGHGVSYLSLGAIIDRLNRMGHDIEVYRESPLTYYGNKVLVWGHGA
jgi:hypothetical protein